MQLARALAERWTSRGNDLIYCIDETDNGDGLHPIALPREAKLEARKEPNLLGAMRLKSSDCQWRRRPAMLWSAPGWLQMHESRQRQVVGGDARQRRVMRLHR